MEQFEQLNKVELVGIVGDCRTNTINNKAYARFSLASSRLDIDEEGNRVIEITWLQCSTFNVPEGLGKGSNVKVSGRLRNQKYVDEKGDVHYSTEIFAQSVEIL